MALPVKIKLLSNNQGMSDLQIPWMAWRVLMLQDQSQNDPGSWTQTEATPACAYGPTATKHRIRATSPALSGRVPQRNKS
jgi:hypothetical protein